MVAAASERLNDGRLVELIESIQDELPGYGYRRVTHGLRRRRHVVNHKRVARVMRAQGLSIRPRRRFVRATDSKRDSPVFPSLYRNVIPTQPNERSAGRRLHLHPDCHRVLLSGRHCGCCSRKEVGYAISRNIDTTLALAAL